MIGISLKQLEAFVAIAAAGSVRAAAQQLFLTQPAVSMALAELERQIGAPLFDRERGRLRLSIRGKELLPMAREVIERVQEMLRPPGNAPADLTGELRIGASNTVGNYLVGELLGPYMAAHPAVALTLSVENTGTIVAGLLEHRLDVGCVEGPVHHPQLDVLSWRDDDMVVCAAHDHPLSSQPRLTPRHFKGAHWILREPGSAMRTLAEQAMNSLPPGRIVLELGQVEAIKQAVIAGMGIACLPAEATTDAVAVGRLKILETPFLDLRRRLSLLLHKARYRGMLIEAFAASLGIGAARPEENAPPSGS